MTRPTLKELWEDLKAKRRKEKRVAPYGIRGRVYLRDGAPSGPSVYGSCATPELTLNIKITRADGTVEYMNAPATIKEV